MSVLRRQGRIVYKKGFRREIVSVFVGCNNCESSTRSYSTEAGAIEAWNNRV